MKRLSDIVDSITCHGCSEDELRILHADIQGDRVNALVQCSACRGKDVVSVNFVEDGAEAKP